MYVKSGCAAHTDSVSTGLVSIALFASASLECLEVQRSTGFTSLPHTTASRAPRHVRSPRLTVSFRKCWISVTGEADRRNYRDTMNAQAPVHFMFHRNGRKPRAEAQTSDFAALLVHTDEDHEYPHSLFVHSYCQSPLLSI